MNIVRSLHLFVAYFIPFAFLTLTLWSVVCVVIKREPWDGFWTLLGIVQVVVAVQFLAGAALFLAGGRPPGAGGPSWLHYLYGAFFPALVLLVAHARARKVPTAPWLIFGFAAFICFGLTFRALQTGLS